jgi:hypothetical protein
VESVRKFKANPKVAGQPCGWCQAQLMLGDDAAVCAACEKEHHAACWDSKAGCANPGCVNAPLKQLEPAVAAAAHQASPVDTLAAQGLMKCRNCGAVLTIGTEICLTCRAITSPDGIYHGPKTNAPGAVASLVMGIVGLFLCGIILGPLAISKANSAKSLMQSDPTLGGEGLATAGKVLGIIAIVGWAIAMVIRFGGMH